jgi:hypothetical protein
MNQVDLQLRNLNRRWIDLSSDSLQRIPALCDEIEAAAALGNTFTETDKSLLRSIEQLSNKAERRLIECLLIQTRSGSYSNHGDLESSRTLATTGWEG